MSSNYFSKLFDNVGWVRGTRSVNGKWGAYLWRLQNRIVFRSSKTNWWVSPSNGVRVEITNVLVGSLGNYGPVSNVVDVGPSINTNFPGSNTGEDRSFGVDITNVFYQLIIPSIWITPRFAVTCIGGSNVQYTVTGTNIPQGVTWTISPTDFVGHAEFQIATNYYASVTPGTVATNYTIRATASNNPNFYDQVSLTVVAVDIVESNVYVGVSNTANLHLTPGSSTNVQWDITPEMQEGASIEGSAVGTSIVVNAGSIPTNYLILASAVALTNCYDTCTVTVLKVELETIATSPPDRARKKLGVGEEVTLTLKPTGHSPITWSKTGDGTLSATSGGSVTFTAHDRASTPSVTATYAGTPCTVDFTVIEPSGTIIEQEPGTGIWHIQGQPSVGFKGRAYELPADVSFYNIETQEGSVNAVATGYFAYQNGQNHAQGPWVTVGDVVAGKGSKEDVVDTIQGGSDNHTPYEAGTFTWAIPWSFRVGSGTPKVFCFHQSYKNN